MVRSLASPWSPCPHWLIRWPRSKVQGVKWPFRRRLLLPFGTVGKPQVQRKLASSICVISVLRCFFWGGWSFLNCFFLFGCFIGCLLVYALRCFRKKIEKLWDWQFLEKVVSLLEKSLIETWWNITHRLEAEVLVWIPLLLSYPSRSLVAYIICYIYSMDPWKILVKIPIPKAPCKSISR